MYLWCIFRTWSNSRFIFIYIDVRIYLSEPYTRWAHCTTEWNAVYYIQCKAFMHSLCAIANRSPYIKFFNIVVSCAVQRYITTICVCHISPTHVVRLFKYGINKYVCILYMYMLCTAHCTSMLLTSVYYYRVQSFWECTQPDRMTKFKWRLRILR